MQCDVRKLVAQHTAPLAVLCAAACVTWKYNHTRRRIGNACTPFGYAMAGDRVELLGVGLVRGQPVGIEPQQTETGPPPLTASTFEGSWINNDPNTRGITRVLLSASGNELTVHPYGSCVPEDCDWGKKTVTFSGQPILALFLAIGVGYLVGQINIGGFSLGVYAEAVHKDPDRPPLGRLARAALLLRRPPARGRRRGTLDLPPPRRQQRVRAGRPPRMPGRSRAVGALPGAARQAPPPLNRGSRICVLTGPSLT